MHSLTRPIGDGAAGDVVEGGGVGAVEPAAGGVGDGFERLGGLVVWTNKVRQANIPALITRDMLVMECEGTDGNRGPRKARVLKLDERRNGLLINHLVAKLDRVPKVGVRAPLKRGVATA